MKNETIKYWDGSVYTGEVTDNMRRGNGKYTLPDGRIVECEWEENHPKYIDRNYKSTGKITFPNGDVYEGYIGSGVIGIIGNPHGTGVYTYADGSVYRGEFVEGEQWGEGVMTWIDGQAFQGHFYKNAPSGNGIMTYPDGTKIEGYFEERNIISPEELAERAAAYRRRLEEECQPLYGNTTDIHKRYSILKEAYFQAHNSGFNDHMAWEASTGRADEAKIEFWQAACRLKREVEALCNIYEKELGDGR